LQDGVTRSDKLEEHSDLVKALVAFVKSRGGRTKFIVSEDEVLEHAEQTRESIAHGMVALHPFMTAFHVKRDLQFDPTLCDEFLFRSDPRPEPSDLTESTVFQSVVSAVIDRISSAQEFTVEGLAAQTGIPEHYVDDAMLKLCARGTDLQDTSTGFAWSSDTLKRLRVIAQPLPRANTVQPKSQHGNATEDGSMDIDVFISHSSSDLEIIKQLVGLLRSALGLSAKQILCTSLNGHRLPGGADVKEEIRKKVQGSKVFIGVLSRASLDSLFVAFELGARWGVGKRIVPLLAPGVSASVLRGPLADFNALELSDEGQIYQLLNDIASQLGITSESPAVFSAQVKALASTGSPPLPELGADDPPVERPRSKRAGLDDQTLVQLLADELPDPGFYLFDALDEQWGTEPGTAKRLAAKAAERRERLGEVTEHGIRFGSYVVQRTWKRRR
jgi:hypothetical protein